jgi:hypothetical protein
MTKLMPVDMFFRANQFADPATYTDAANATHSILVIFDREEMDIKIGGTDYQAVGPTALCKSSDVPTVTNKCKLQIGSDVYHIVKVHPSTTGITMFELSKDATS